MLTRTDIAILNAARVVVHDLEQRTYHMEQTVNVGRYAHACSVAGDALFQLLNTADSYLGAHLTEDELHFVHRPKHETPDE